MPRDDNIRMPSSSAGVMSFYDEERSAVRLKPSHIVILSVVVVILVLLLNYTTIFR